MKMNWGLLPKPLKCEILVFSLSHDETVSLGRVLSRVGQLKRICKEVKSLLHDNQTWSLIYLRMGYQVRATPISDTLYHNLILKRIIPNNYSRSAKSVQKSNEGRYGIYRHGLLHGWDDTCVVLPEMEGSITNVITTKTFIELLIYFNIEIDGDEVLETRTTCAYDTENNVFLWKLVAHAWYVEGSFIYMESIKRLGDTNYFIVDLFTGETLIESDKVEGITLNGDGSGYTLWFLK